MRKNEATSMSEKVLIAAFEKWPQEDFVAEALVVACWQKYPDVFGLQGFTDRYPDSNVVYRHLMGKDSIVKKQRWMIQAGPKRYRLTPAGIRHALSIVKGQAEDAEAQYQRVERSQEQLLLRVISSPAWKKYVAGSTDEITFTDACGFWSITPRSSGEQYRSARRNLNTALAEAESRLADRGGAISLLSRASLLKEDLRGLRMLQETLEAKFGDQLSVINGRSVRWGKVSG